jgi:hypothetical protein
MKVATASRIKPQAFEINQVKFASYFSASHPVAQNRYTLGETPYPYKSTPPPPPPPPPQPAVAEELRATSIANQRIVKAKAERKREDERQQAILKARERNGIVLNFDGSFAVVQHKRFNAPLRAIPQNLESSSSSSSLPLQEPGSYRRVKYSFCSRECNIATHRHSEDIVAWKLRSNSHGIRQTCAELLSEQSRADPSSFISLLLMESPSNDIAADVTDIEADAYTKLPWYVQDLLSILIAYEREQIVAFESSANDLAWINCCAETSDKSIDDHGAAEECTATFNTSREAVRAQFTETRDVIATSLVESLVFYTKRCVDAKILKPAAHAIVPSLMQKLFRDYTAHRNQQQLLKDVLLAFENALMNNKN